jgi:phosphoribosylanthranilate isomerase
VDISTARAISDAIGSRALVVGVVADLSVETMKGLKDDAHLGCLQLHGDESPEALLALLPHAYKALRIADAADVARAATFPGEYLLADAKVAGALGGTGHVFDWSLVTELAKTRKLTLAGGLTPVNVADAVRAVRPFSVDVASGVEDRGEPRKKNAQLVRSFVQMVRSADD